AEGLVVEAVRILRGEPLPAQCPVGFERVGLDAAGRRVARIPVIEQSHVVAEVALPERSLVAAVEVPLEAAAGLVGVEVAQPADVGRPRPDVEAARMAVVEPALE